MDHESDYYILPHLILPINTIFGLLLLLEVNVVLCFCSRDVIGLSLLLYRSIFSVLRRPAFAVWIRHCNIGVGRTLPTICRIRTGIFTLSRPFFLFFGKGPIESRDCPWLQKTPSLELVHVPLISFKHVTMVAPFLIVALRFSKRTCRARRAAAGNAERGIHTRGLLIAAQ